MLGKTSISAIRALLLLAQGRGGARWTPRRIAAELGESPTYMAKIVRQLVKTNILEAEKGAKGGVWFARRAEEVTLLAVVESCQGTIVGDFCRSERAEESWCGFHVAAAELHGAVTGVLARWTVARLLERRPGRCDEADG
ncbi:MAG: Rrf2 family transcriptional regulator, partial [Acidobacteria bacterium]|nr:Rrf2 family transcriptional regulator [Acidobacteriota bacterium]